MEKFILVHFFCHACKISTVDFNRLLFSQKIPSQIFVRVSGYDIRLRKTIANHCNSSNTICGITSLEVGQLYIQFWNSCYSFILTATVYGNFQLSQVKDFLFIGKSKCQLNHFTPCLISIPLQCVRKPSVSIPPEKVRKSLLF